MHSSKANSRAPSQDLYIGKLILSKYTLLSKLGEGSFGKTYSASTTDGKLYAIKFEKRIKTNQLLEIEGYILNYLKGPGIPHYELYSSTQEYNLLIMQLLGKSLEKILSLSPYKSFNIRTVCNLIIQMLSILKHIHDNHIIHRDLKPDNFTMGLDKERNKVFLIDFGLAKKYRSSKTLEQFPFKKGKKLTGTARYASINALGGYEQSRRDDLESISYVMMYLLKGSLPWQGLPMKKVDERYVKIYEKKKAVTAWELCRGFPKQFEEFVSYTRKLGYKQNPNYDYLQQLMKDVLAREGFEFDYYTEWNASGSSSGGGVNSSKCRGGRNVKEKKNVLTVDRCCQKNCKTYSNFNYNSNQSNAAIFLSMNNKSNDCCSPQGKDYNKKEGNDNNNNNNNNKVIKGSGVSFNKITVPLKRHKSLEYIESPFDKVLSHKKNEHNNNNNDNNNKNDEHNNNINNLKEPIITEQLKKHSKTLVINDNMEEKVIIYTGQNNQTGKSNKQIYNNQNTKSGRGFNDSNINTRRKGNQPLYQKLSTSEHRGSRCCIM
jgi:serine/threonine protein kinase